jgi:hypothetical protein
LPGLALDWQFFHLHLLGSWDYRHALLVVEMGSHYLFAWPALSPLSPYLYLPVLFYFLSSSILEIFQNLRLF